MHLLKMVLVCRDCKKEFRLKNVKIDEATFALVTGPDPYTGQWNHYAQIVLVCTNKQCNSTEFSQQQQLTNR